MGVRACVFCLVVAAANCVPCALKRRIDVLYNSVLVVTKVCVCVCVFIFAYLFSERCLAYMTVYMSFMCTVPCLA